VTVEDLEPSILRSVQRKSGTLHRERLDILYLQQPGRPATRTLPARVLSVEDVVGRGGVADILVRAQTQRHREPQSGFTGIGHTDFSLACAFRQDPF